MQAKAKDYHLVWNPVTNRFYKAKVTDGVPAYETYPSLDNPTEAAYTMWTIDSKPSDIFSTYLYQYQATEEGLNITTGLDVGNETVTSITYNGGDSAKKVVIRTNGGALTINAPNDTVERYGYCDFLDIQAIKSTSLYEYGTSAMVSINSGRIVLENAESTPVILVESNNAIVAVAGNVEMPEIKRAAEVTSFKLQTVTQEADGTVNKNTETTVSISESTITTETKDANDQPVAAPANVKVAAVKETVQNAANKETVKNENVPVTITTLEELQAYISGNVVNGVLGADITPTETLKIESNKVIDFNGHTISSSNLTPDDSKNPRVVYVKNGEVTLKDTSLGEKGGIIYNYNGSTKMNVLDIRANEGDNAKVTIQNGVQFKNESTSSSSYSIYLYGFNGNSSLVIDDAYIYSRAGTGIYAAGSKGSFVINDCEIDAGKYALEHKNGTQGGVINGGEFNTRSTSYNSLSWVYATINGGTFNKWKTYDISKLSSTVSHVVLEGTKMTIVDGAPSNYVASRKINEINCYKLDTNISSLITSDILDAHIDVVKDATINYSTFGQTTVDSFVKLELNVASGATLTGTIKTKSAIVEKGGEGNFNVEITPYSDDFETTVNGNQTTSAYKEEKIVAIGTRSTGEEVRLTMTPFDNNNLTSNYVKVKLIRDIDLTKPLSINNDFTLDLNGHTITGNAINTSISSYISLIKVASRGVDLTITDSSAEQTGSIVSTNPDLYCVHVGSTSMSSNVIINGGRFITASCTTINVQLGSVEINGGYFEATHIDGGKYNINCIDANYKAGTATISVKGGTFKNFNPADNTAEGADTSYLAEGYKVVETTDGEDKIYTVVVKEA